MMTEQTTIGKYLLDALHKKGIEHIFGVPGDYVLNLDKLIEQHPIKFINATRESTAGYMADAYARMRGLGVACITYGVGINIVNALAQAYVESSPLIVISGGASTKDLQKGIKMHHLIHQRLPKHGDNTQLEIFKPVTIGQAVLDDPTLAAEQIDAIVELCFSSKKPVYIEIPSDKVNAPLTQTKKNHTHPKTQSPHHHLNEALETCVNVIKKSKCPFIWAGHEIQRYGLSAQLLAFAEKFNIPIATSLLGKALIDEGHPLSIGVYQGLMSRPEVIEFIDKCDCALMLGLLLTDVETGIFTANLNQKRCIIANAQTIDIDSHQFKDVAFNNFINELAEIPHGYAFKNPFPSRVDTKNQTFTPKRSTKITTKRTFECIQSHIQPDHIIFAEIGDCLFGSSDLILPKDGFMACAHFGSLGFATPGCIGAQIADPNKRLIGLVGDGAFQMTGTELSNAIRYQVNPIIIVFNNHGYGTERPLLEGSYNDIHNWNYSILPKVLGGGVGTLTNTEEELNNALQKAVDDKHHYHLIEVNLEKTDFSPVLQRLAKLVNSS